MSVFFLCHFGLIFFFFSSRRRHTRCLSDWSRRVLFRSPAVRANRRLEWAQVLPPLLPPALHGLDDRLSRLAVYQRWRRSSLGTWLFGQRQLDLVGLEESGLVGDLRYDPFAITREIDTEQIRRAWALTGRYVR